MKTFSLAFLAGHGICRHAWFMYGRLVGWLVLTYSATPAQTGRRTIVIGMLWWLCVKPLASKGYRVISIIVSVSSAKSQPYLNQFPNLLGNISQPVGKYFSTGWEIFLNTLGIRKTLANDHQAVTEDDIKP